MANKASIRDKVSIVGVGCCQFGENWDQSPSDMIVDAAYEAYADAGIEKPQEQIDAVFTGSIYSNKGPHECADALKLFNKPVSFSTNYCATGTDLIRLATLSIAAGVYDTVLVVGYDKPKDRGVSGPSVVVDRVRDLPQTPAGWFSLAAATYFEKYGAGREDLAKIAIKNHANGCLAPKSFLKRPITEEDYFKARIISWPFGLYDSAAQTDGAAAAILTRTDLASHYSKEPVLVKGVTVRAGPNPQKDPGHDFLSWKPTAWARDDVYEMAGVTNAREQIGLAQHDCSPMEPSPRGPRLLREGLRQGAHSPRRLRADRWPARQHGRRPQDLRASDGGRPACAWSTRTLQPGARRASAVKGHRRQARPLPQHRRSPHGLRHRDPRTRLTSGLPCPASHPMPARAPRAPRRETRNER
ncbi:MAG: hypothetical protein R3E53_20725 [Myxococcota bacterium]